MRSNKTEVKMPIIKQIVLVHPIPCDLIIYTFITHNPTATTQYSLCQSSKLRMYPIDNSTPLYQQQQQCTRMRAQERFTTPTSNTVLATYQGSISKRKTECRTNRVTREQCGESHGMRGEQQTTGDYAKHTAAAAKNSKRRGKRESQHDKNACKPQDAVHNNTNSCSAGHSGSKANRGKG
jgi:hypothetical protein